MLNNCTGFEGRCMGHCVYCLDCKPGMVTYQHPDIVAKALFRALQCAFATIPVQLCMGIQAV